MYCYNIPFSYLVDSPGYGFGGGKRSSNNFKKLLRHYLLNSQRLCSIYWLIYAEHGFTNDDRIIFNFIKNLNIPINLVFTKSDMFNQVDLLNKIKSLTHPFKSFKDVVSPKIFITSAESRFGIYDLQVSLKQNFMENKVRDVLMKGGKVEYVENQSLTQFEKETFKLLIEEDYKIFMKNQNNF